jgi:hypothetical protein
MSILGFLKRIKTPSFEEEFIQDPAERLIEEGKAGKTGRIPALFDEEWNEKEADESRKRWENDPLNPANPFGIDAQRSSGEY